MTDYENAMEIAETVTAASERLETQLAAATDRLDALAQVAEQLDELSSLTERLDVLNDTATRIAAALEQLARQHHAASRAAYGEAYTRLILEADRAREQCP